MTVCSIQKLLLAAGLLLSGMAATHAQDPASAAAASARSTITAAGIPARADLDEQLAERVLQRIDTQDPGDRLSAQLDELATAVDTRQTEFTQEELIHLPVMRLESLERHLAFDARRLQRWQAEMRGRLGPFASDAAELVRRRAEWEATRALTGEGALPPALSGRVDEVIATLKAAEDRLSTPLSRNIALGQQAIAVEARIDNGRRTIETAIAEIDRRLFRIDVAPIWQLHAVSRGNQDEFASVQKGIHIEGRFAKEYGESETGQRIGLAAVQLLLLPLLGWFALRVRHSEASRYMGEASARVFRRPVATWILLAMTAVLVFEPDAPLLVHEIVMFIALVPVLRLLPLQAHPLLRATALAITALYLTDRLGIFLMGSSVLYRIFQLSLTALAMALVVWLLHREHRQAEQREGWFQRILAGGLRVGIVLLATSAVANVLGNVSLAEMLTHGFIESSYFALMLFAGATVVAAIFQTLLREPAVARMRLLRENQAAIQRTLRRLLTLAAVLGWCVYTMENFRILRPLYRIASDVLSHEFEAGEISISLGNVLVFAVSVLIAFWTARFVRMLLRDELLVRVSLPRGVGNSVASLSYYALLIVGLLVALSAAGFKIGQLALLFGALGVGIGFGLQNIVNNFVSGLVLMFERPIQPGDVVDVGGTSGRVHTIGMRATTLRTFDGADVVVPNGNLLSANLTNWTLLDRSRRIEVPVGVAYGSAPEQVLDLLRRIAAETPEVAQNPAPVAYFSGFGPSSLDFIVRAWTHDFDHWVAIRSDMVTRIHTALGQAGISLPFPQQDLHLRTVSKEAGEMLRRDGTPPEGVEPR